MGIGAKVSAWTKGQGVPGSRGVKITTYQQNVSDG